MRLSWLVAIKGIALAVVARLVLLLRVKVELRCAGTDMCVYDDAAEKIQGEGGCK